MTNPINRNRLDRILILASTDFKQRYFDSYLGLIWALINPIAKVVIFYYVFTILFNNQTDNFALYLFLGIIFWGFFSESTNKGITLFRSKSYLIKNIRINKIDIFLSSTLSTFYGFLFNLSIFFIGAIISSVNFSYYILFLPLILINILILVIAVKMILSVLYGFIKDINHFWDIFLLAGFWAVPIVWDHQILNDKAKFLVHINPLAGIVINLRKVLFYNQSPDLKIMAYTFLFSLLFLSIGLFLVKKYSYKSIEQK